MRSAVPILPLLVLLAACAPPRQRCEEAALRDIRVIDGLIAESEATLARGYAIETREVPRTIVTGCWGWGIGHGDVGFCTRTHVRTERRPVAVNLDAERATLASLREERARKAAAVQPVLAQCAISHPRGGPAQTP
jgi:hypothetical protein